MEFVLSPEIQVEIDVFMGVATLLMIGAILWVGIKEIRQLRTQLEWVIKTSRGALLPQIDARSCDPVMSCAYQHLRTIYSEIRKQCTESDRGSEAYKAQFLGEATKILAEWREKKTTKYLELMGICDFYEVVGLFCFREYLNPDDILDLYSLPIIKAGVAFKTHIKGRQSKENICIYERFLELFEKAQNFRPDYDPVNQQE